MNKKMYKRRDTIRAIAEAQELAENPHAKTYTCFEEMVKDILQTKRDKQREKCSKLYKSI